ncbi:MAG TPA: GIY-YIG nuclease family protein, partial [Gammaproteobacteria bacterium]|nr:GIY-YIG nuclease family protein [Gammaproteobacteria bacterium]
MKQAGLYIVTLNNAVPISVNANDPRIASKCITVTSANCKFGKAKNLATRSKNYESVFGPENVNFFPIVTLENIAAAERAVLDRLSQWRVRGNSGRKNEWLVGISSFEVEHIVLETLTKAG